MREARTSLDGIRAAATQFEVNQATAASDLAHLETTAAEAVQASLDEVLAEVEQLERDGAAVPDARALHVDDGVDDGRRGYAASRSPERRRRPTRRAPSRRKKPSTACARRSIGSAPST